MMNANRAFMDIPRADHAYRPAEIRKHDFREVELPLTSQELREQASRCMNCGIAFCHGAGCPLGNLIPEINAAAGKGDFETAWALLGRTSFFPEFTSRICPALCEGACVCGINFGPVTVRRIERIVVERAFADGRVLPPIPQKENGRHVAVVGSGPAGLAAAVRLRLAGCQVTVFESHRAAGGLLRYGIPAFKLEKSVIDRRIKLLESAGIKFVTSTVVGRDIAAEYLVRNFDAVVLATGSPVPRDLAIPGRELADIHFALEFLGESPISARGRHVLVIGGGDTGSDCVGTAVRQGAASVRQIEIMPRPSDGRSVHTPWPDWPQMLRTSSSHEEAGSAIRRWNLQSLRFLGENAVSGVEVEEVSWTCDPVSGRPKSFVPAGKPEVIQADLVLLAMGFLKFKREETLQRYNLAEHSNIFISGDAANGPSLVVRAIVHGRQTADDVIRFIGGQA